MQNRDEIIEVGGQQYEVLKRWRNTRTGRSVVGIYNDRREQYEVHFDHQERVNVPVGVDSSSLDVAFYGSFLAKY